jgi:hypothetical protein
MIFAAIYEQSCEAVGCCWDSSIPNTPNCYHTFGNNISDTEMLERNARAQITAWGPQASSLSEYSYRLWNGLISDYYYPRWNAWFEGTTAALASGQPFNEGNFTGYLQQWQEVWIFEQGNPFAQEPSGDAFTLAQSIAAAFFGL